MSKSLRIERVKAIAANNVLKKFEIGISDTTGIEDVLREMGFDSIAYSQSLRNGENMEVYDFAAGRGKAVSIGIRKISSSWEFAGYGSHSEVEKISRRFVDLLGAYHVMSVMDAHGISFQIDKNEDSIAIQIG